MTFSLHPTLERDSVWVCDLPLSQVRMILDANYPWYLLVPRLPEVTELSDLTSEEYIQLWKESQQLSQVMQQLYRPDKFNVASLGNLVPQLHVHHIARYKTDIAWPKPVWGVAPSVSYSAELLKTRIANVADLLNKSN